MSQAAIGGKSRGKAASGKRCLGELAASLGEPRGFCGQGRGLESRLLQGSESSLPCSQFPQWSQGLHHWPESCVRKQVWVGTASLSV